MWNLHGVWHGVLIIAIVTQHAASKDSFIGKDCTRDEECNIPKGILCDKADFTCRLSVGKNCQKTDDCTAGAYCNTEEYECRCNKHVSRSIHLGRCVPLIGMANSNCSTKQPCTSDSTVCQGVCTCTVDSALNRATFSCVKLALGESRALQTDSLAAGIIGGSVLVIGAVLGIALVAVNRPNKTGNKGCCGCGGSADQNDDFEFHPAHEMKRQMSLEVSTGAEIEDEVCDEEEDEAPDVNVPEIVVISATERSVSGEASKTSSPQVSQTTPVFGKEGEGKLGDDDSEGSWV